MAQAHVASGVRPPHPRSVCVRFVAQDGRGGVFQGMLDLDEVGSSLPGSVRQDKRDGAVREVSGNGGGARVSRSMRMHALHVVDVLVCRRAVGARPGCRSCCVWQVSSNTEWLTWCTSSRLSRELQGRLRISNGNQRPMDVHAIQPAAGAGAARIITAAPSSAIMEDVEVAGDDAAPARSTGTGTGTDTGTGGPAGDAAQMPRSIYMAELGDNYPEEATNGSQGKHRQAARAGRGRNELKHGMAERLEGRDKPGTGTDIASSKFVMVVEVRALHRLHCLYWLLLLLEEPVDHLEDAKVRWAP